MLQSIEVAYDSKKSIFTGMFVYLEKETTLVSVMLIFITLTLQKPRTESSYCNRKKSAGHLTAPKLSSVKIRRLRYYPHCVSHL
jgi:hypothetical protein